MIDSTHVLSGLMWPNTSRAQVLFGLREKFPQYGRETYGSLVATWTSKDLLLTDEVKKILYYSAREADEIGDAWVDTDHLLLGILCISDCQIAQQLSAAGLTLENARATIIKNRPSRPDYGPVIPLGTTPSPQVWLKSKWCWWRARRSEKRFAARQNR